MKYINYVVLALLLVTTFILKDSVHMSTNLLSLFASEKSVETLNIASELGYSKELLIAVKGFDANSRITVDKVAKSLESIDGIDLVQSKITPSKELKSYYQDYYALISKFDVSEQSKDVIHKKLEKLRDEQLNSLLYTPINKNDPLALFDLKVKSSSFTSRDAYMTLGDYGYLIYARTDVSPSDVEDARLLYFKIKNTTAEYENVIAFSGFFYTVENSMKIKEDVRFIITLSIVTLLLMYLVLLKNVKLLSNVVITLTSSVLFAGLISSMVYDDFHIIALAFGASMSGVSIDYLFHYYFHNFYRSKSILDRNVFYGYLTTITALVILSSIPVPLISQISFFTVFALTFAYVMFTFVYKKIMLKKFKEKNVSRANFAIVPSFVFVLLSLGLLFYSLMNMKLDHNVRNLDYHNTELRKTENIFKESTQKSLTPVIVQAKTQDELIHKLHTLENTLPNTFSLASFVLDKEQYEARKNILDAYDFSTVKKTLDTEARVLGFKDDYFKEAYHFVDDLPSYDSVNLDIFKSLNLQVYERRGIYYTVALVEDVNKSLTLEFVHDIDVKKMFKKVAEKMYKDIHDYAAVVVIIVLLLLLISVKKRFFYAMNYILFPLSLTLAILVTITEINMMHIFAFIILVAIGIDYGIYMSNTHKKSNTLLAIKYSLLSTFSAFGVLVFSSITALNSIGTVITIGTGAIYVLLKVMK